MVSPFLSTVVSGIGNGVSIQFNASGLSFGSPNTVVRDNIVGESECSIGVSVGEDSSFESIEARAVDVVKGSNSKDSIS